MKNYKLLLLEIKRILKSRGIFVMILYSGRLNDWQRQKEINNFSQGEWKKILEKKGFEVEGYKKKSLLFFKCRKDKLIK